jgi:hypothetical protein
MNPPSAVFQVTNGRLTTCSEGYPIALAVG